MKKQQTQQNGLILMGVVLFLLIFSGVQAIQIDTIKDTVEQTQIAGYRQPLQSASAQGTPRSAPTMVGGC